MATIGTDLRDFYRLGGEGSGLAVFDLVRNYERAGRALPMGEVLAGTRKCSALTKHSTSCKAWAAYTLGRYPLCASHLPLNIVEKRRATAARRIRTKAEVSNDIARASAGVTIERCAPAPRSCPSCWGSGFDDWDRQCRACKGKGLTLQDG